MTSALATQKNEVLQLAEVDDAFLKQLYQLYYNPKTMTPEQEPTRSELIIYAQYCAANGMDPLGKDVYFIKDKKGKVHYQISIDGLRGRSESSGEYVGRKGPYWCGKDGVWHDFWILDEAPMGARVGIIRKGCEEPFWGFARLASYRQSEQSWSNWGKMPEVMLAKCAESQAHRAAFPKNCSRLYIPEEMHEVIEGQVMAELPKPEPKRFGSPNVTPASLTPRNSVQAPEQQQAKPAEPPDQEPEANVAPAITITEQGEIIEESIDLVQTAEDIFAACATDTPATEEEITDAWKAWSGVYGRGPEARDKLINDLGVKSMKTASRRDILAIYNHLDALAGEAPF